MCPGERADQHECRGIAIGRYIVLNAHDTSSRHEVFMSSSSRLELLEANSQLLSIGLTLFSRGQ
jgi:hypothetical protein